MRKTRSTWTPEERAFVRQFYYDLTNQEIADKLNKSKRSVINQAKKMGLSKEEIRKRS